LHPWDDGLSAELRESAFNQQAMEDTEAAVHRILERRPEVAVMEKTVLDPHSSALLASGTVQRSAIDAFAFAHHQFACGWENWASGTSLRVPTRAQAVSNREASQPGIVTTDASPEFIGQQRCVYAPFMSCLCSQR